MTKDEEVEWRRMELRISIRRKGDIIFAIAWITAYIVVYSFSIYTEGEINTK